MNTLEEKFYKAIQQNIFADCNDEWIQTGVAAKDCAVICEKYAVDFAEFIARGLWYRYIDTMEKIDGWERYGKDDSLKEFATTEELLQRFNLENSNKSK